VNYDDHDDAIEVEAHGIEFDNKGNERDHANTDDKGNGASAINDTIGCMVLFYVKSNGCI
jgi:hypothetical protein